MSERKQPAAKRSALVANLNHAVREATGLGVLFGEMVATRLGINSTDLECLGVIEARGGATAGELATATELTTGAITGVLDRLERAGLVRRRRDRDDRRRVNVVFTDKARAQVAAHYGPLGRAADALVSSYSDAEVALLIDYFSRSREMMQAEIARLRKRR
jgi:DNA-binding MarR family transcriptional regulator